MSPPVTHPSVPGPIDLAEIRRQARADVGSGALTQDYAADPQAVIRVLNLALAGELMATLRYRRDAIVASGILSRAVAAEFRAHAEQEMGHAERIAQRIVELGGMPDFTPDTLRERSYSEHRPAHSLAEMIEESLVAERAAVSFYRQAVQWLGDRDPSTRNMLEEILLVEERHAHDMSELLPGSASGAGDSAAERRR